jgi:hypothetical protein
MILIISSRFERELEALRKELAEATAAGYPGSGANTPHHMPTSPPRDGTSISSDPDESSASSAGSPLVVARNGSNVITEDLSLDPNAKKNQ